MFKGLRTKIESEQKGTSLQSKPLSRVPSQVQASLSDTDGGRLSPSNGDVPNPNLSSKTATKISDHNDVGLVARLDGSTQQSAEISIAANSSSQRGDHVDSQPSTATSSHLQEQHSDLREQLRTVIRERDENNEQNAQLYQLIEKLRKNLDDERQANNSLKARLDETLKEKDELSRSLKGRPNASLSILDFGSRLSDLATTQSSDDMNIMHQKIHELQNQLSEKTRQLKIRQQNLNDIKKTLQRELQEHGKTQEELCRVRSQLEQCQKESLTDPIHANGSTECDNNFTTRPNTSSEQNNNHDVGDDPIIFGRAPQPDSISCISRSSASIEEYDSNDLHQSKEVNQEYLRNVLFRYMTSTDSETTQHLVKAISVLMNFNSEQIAAIRKVAHARSSWLRLK